MNCDEELLAAAIAAPQPAERDAFLRRECTGNPAHYERQARVRRRHDAAGTLLTAALEVRTAVESARVALGRIAITGCRSSFLPAMTVRPWSGLNKIVVWVS